MYYKVNASYNRLSNWTNGDEKNLSESFGKVKALPSTQLRAWRVLHNIIATKVNLVRMSIIVDSAICVTCGEVKEDTPYLFFM